VWTRSRRRCCLHAKLIPYPAAGPFTASTTGARILAKHWIAPQKKRFTRLRRVGTFNESGPVALIDWEISSIGPILLDLGWISFFADRLNASDTAAPGLLSPEEMVPSMRKLPLR
jgi:hypothetical protein